MSERPLREEMIQTMMEQFGCDLATAEVLMERIADRLAGFSHDEVIEKHPLPVAGGPGDTT